MSTDPKYFNKIISMLDLLVEELPAAKKQITTICKKFNIEFTYFMKIEINLDDKFFEEKFKRYRSASFSKSLDLLKLECTQIAQKKMGRYPSFVLDSKVLTSEFAKLLGVKTAKIYQVDSSIEDIEFINNTVIKPMYEHSAKGVFIYSDNEIVYLNKNIKFNNKEDAKQYAIGLVKDGTIRRDKWMVEEVIGQSGSIARDLKFYCFYGEVGIILESDRLPGLRRCWYDDSFNIVNTGKYVNSSFEGDNNAIELKPLLDLAKEISLELPIPFVRIDFLVLNNEIFLGEFTPIPGGYTSFNQEWDQKLGEIYQSAMARISNDVAYGKVFDKYQKLVKNERKVIDKMKLEISQASID